MKNETNISLTVSAEELLHLKTDDNRKYFERK